MSQVLTDGDDYLNSATSSNTVYALDGRDTVVINNDTYSFYNLYGGEGSDFLGIAVDGPNSYLYGGGGSDTLHGGTLGDNLYGNDGSDFLVGGEYFYSNLSSNGSVVQYDSQSGDDLLTGDDGTDALYGLDGDDHLYGGDDDDSGTIQALNYNGSFYPVAAGLYGGSGFDYLDGGQGDDYLDGGSDDDTLLGGDGNDTLQGGTGADRMEGGAGDDTYYVDNVDDRVVEAGSSGADKLLSSVSYTLRTGQVVETIRPVSLGGTETIALAGNEYSQTVQGNAGINKLFGYAGDDSLYGYDGNDTLAGGLGADKLYGGLGNDIFVFDTALGAGNIDTISDFVSNTSGNNDTIRLENAIFTALTATGTLAADLFAANATGVATQADDRIIYETDTGKLFYDSDGSGSHSAVQFATLSGHPLIAANDFVVV